MIRVRFCSDFKDNGRDFRPIKFPPPYPYWRTGENNKGFIIVAYFDSIEQLKEYYPEAHDIESEEVEEIFFSDRFPKPDWYNK